MKNGGKMSEKLKMLNDAETYFKAYRFPKGAELV